MTEKFNSEGSHLWNQHQNDLLRYLNTLEGTLYTPRYVGPEDRSIFICDDSERKPLRRKNEAKVYEGSWHYQAFEPTCVAWTIANAGLVLGVKPDMDCIHTISRIAKRERYGKFGVSLEYAAIITQIFQSMPYVLSCLYKAKVSNQDKPEVTKYPYHIDDKHPRPNLDGDQNLRSPDISASFDRSATTIVDILSSGSAIITGVSSKEFARAEGAHAICVSGYRINDQGFLDYQIVDSHRGIYWVSREHLESSYNSYPMYLARLKD